MSRIVLDKRTRTPGGRFAWTILGAGSYTKASHPATTYSNVFDLGEWDFLQIILDVYATSVTDAGDYLDVSVHFSTNGVLYFSAGAFVQLAGNAVASRHVIAFKSDLSVDPDAIWTIAAAAAVIDEKAFGRYMKVGVAVTDAAADAIHQFKVTGYIK